jgi:aldose 1-epimerase
MGGSAEENAMIDPFQLSKSSTGPRAQALATSRGKFGLTRRGETIEHVDLTDGTGLRARILTLGATLQALEVPDRHGRYDDVVLGFAEPDAYLDHGQYIGATVGRYANRIAGGRFELDGRTYQIPRNDGANALHGGPDGFDKRVWTIERLEADPQPSVTLAYESPDGEEGFPGTLRVEAVFTLRGPGELSVEYRATTDRPTLANITNHSYFNLAGEAVGRDVMDQRLTLNAHAFTPVDAGLIPTGECRPVEGTAFDFRTPTPIGAHIRDGREAQLGPGRGYDHNFVLDGEAGALRPIARLEDPDTGRTMDLLSTAPGVQFYSGNALNGSLVGKSGRVYRQGDALALEPQLFPDSPNRPDFPSARLDPGHTYTNRMVFRFSAAAH